jgi:hypothetical protein
MALTYPSPIVHVILPLHLLLLLGEGMILSLLKRRLAHLRIIYFPVFVALWQCRRILHAERVTIARQGGHAKADIFAVMECVPYKLRMLVKHGLPQIT